MFMLIKEKTWVRKVNWGSANQIVIIVHVLVLAVIARGLGQFFL